MKLKHIIGLLLSEFLSHSLVQSSPPSNKLFYEVNPQYQNQIDSQTGQAILPQFSPEPADFVYGGIFALSDLNTDETQFSGYQDALAMQCAIKELNRIAEPVLGLNTTFYYQIINSGFDPNTAMMAAAQLLDAGVPALITSTDSNSGVAIASLYASFNISILSGSTTANVLSDKNAFGSYYRTIPSDSITAAVIADLMLYFNWTLVTPIYSDSVYGLSGQTEFTQQAINNGILVTCGRVIVSGTTSGLQSTSNCLTTSQSKVVLLWMSATDASNVIATLYNNTALQDLTFIATDTWALYPDAEEFTQGRFPVSYLEGSLGVTQYRGNQTSYFDCVSEFNLSNVDLPFFVDYWEKIFRCNVTQNSEMPVCPQNLTDRAASPFINCTCRGDENLANVPASLDVTYINDAVFAVAYAFNQIKYNCTGLTQATGVDYCNQTSISTVDLQRAIAYTNFEGTSGPVSFSGNDRSNSIYEITQRRSDGVPVRVGASLNGSLLYIDSSLLQFKGGSTPVSMIVPKQITISDPLGYAVLVFIVIGLVISLALSVYFYLNRKQKVVKKTSPFFSQLMLLGIILCIGSQIIWELSQTTFTCILKIWMLAIGFGLIMGNLLAKTYRIFKIFSNARVTSLVIRDWDLLKFSGAVIACEIVLLSLYTFPSGLPTPVDIQSTSDNLLIYVQCQVPSSFIQIGGTIWLLGFNFLLVLCAVILAYLTRNVDSAFNESRYIAYTVYIYLLVAIILLPLYYTAGDSSSSVSRQFIIRSIAVLVSMYFTLAALFLPKFYLVYRTKRAEAKMAPKAESGKAGRRVVGLETTTAGGPTTGFPAGSTAGGGVFARVLRGDTTTTTTANVSTTSDDDLAAAQGLPTMKESTTSSRPVASEYSSLFTANYGKKSR